MSKKFTIVGTNIEEVKRLNDQSGLSYNQAKELLAQQMQRKYHSINRLEDVKR